MVVKILLILLFVVLLLLIIVLLVINKEPHILSMISWIFFFYIIRNIHISKNTNSFSTFGEYSIHHIISKRSREKHAEEK